jgi:hypothetical protein
MNVMIIAPDIPPFFSAAHHLGPNKKTKYFIDIIDFKR